MAWQLQVYLKQRNINYSPVFTLSLSQWPFVVLLGLSPWSWVPTFCLFPRAYSREPMSPGTHASSIHLRVMLGFAQLHGITFLLNMNFYHTKSYILCFNCCILGGVGAHVAERTNLVFTVMILSRILGWDYYILQEQRITEAFEFWALGIGCLWGAGAKTHLYITYWSPCLC